MWWSLALYLFILEQRKLQKGLLPRNLIICFCLFFSEALYNKRFFRYLHYQTLYSCYSMLPETSQNAKAPQITLTSVEMFTLSPLCISWYTCRQTVQNNIRTLPQRCFAYSNNFAHRFLYQHVKLSSLSMVSFFPFSFNFILCPIKLSNGTQREVEEVPFRSLGMHLFEHLVNSVPRLSNASDKTRCNGYGAQKPACLC